MIAPMVVPEGTIRELRIVPHEDCKNIAVSDSTVEQQSSNLVGIFIQVFVSEHVVAMLAPLKHEYLSIGHLLCPNLHKMRCNGLIEVSLRPH